MQNTNVMVNILYLANNKSGCSNTLTVVHRITSNNYQIIYRLISVFNFFESFVRTHEKLLIWNFVLFVLLTCS